MSNSRGRSKMLRTGLSVRPISRTCFIKCAFLDGYKRSLHCPLFSHPKLITWENDRAKTTCSRFIAVSCSYNNSNWFSLSMFFCQVSRTTVRSLEVLILFLFDVTTPHHSCSVANMACDRLVSVGRMLTLLVVLARGATCTRLIAGAKEAGFDVHSISFASGSADVLGCEVSPANTYCCGKGKRIARTVSSRRDGGGARQWSRVFLGTREGVAWNKKHSGRFFVSSTVIGVCAGLMSASVRMRQKRVRVRGSSRMS